MKFLIYVVLFFSTYSIAQDFQSSPEALMNEIFRAANERDFENLDKMCLPGNQSDGDSKMICAITDDSDENKAEFVKYFEGAKLNGEINLYQTDSGIDCANVPFHFNHPSGESRSNETMKMMKVDGKWYLLSF